MTEERPTRRDLMKPAQLLGLSVLAALFAGFVTLMAMGFFQNRFPSESPHALVVASIVAGVTFIVTLVVIALLLLVVDPADVVKTIDQPLLVADDERNAQRAAKKDAARRGEPDDAGAPPAGPTPPVS